MSQPLHDLTKSALGVRDSYRDLQQHQHRADWTAQDYALGFVGDVGDLSKLVMAKRGLRRGPEDIDAALAHELSDCLWSVMVIADELGIDLEAAFVRTMAELQQRIEHEKTAA